MIMKLKRPLSTRNRKDQNHSDQQNLLLLVDKEDYNRV